jgi:catechol 2,3-dioxygenase-like lactoylglutathione lyase family enzyme
VNPSIPTDAIIEFYMLEIAVADPARTAAWFRDRFGFQTVLADESHGFVLMQSGAFRLALKLGSPQTAFGKIAFRVDDLEAERHRLATLGITPSGPIKCSDEGYRSLNFIDPDGYRIEIFEWVR